MCDADVFRAILNLSVIPLLVFKGRALPCIAMGFSVAMLSAFVALRRRRRPDCIAWVGTALCALMMALCAAVCGKSVREPPPGKFTTVRGVLSEDSALTSSGGTLYSVMAGEFAADGVSVRTLAAISVIERDAGVRGICGDEYEFRISGAIADGLYAADSSRIISESRLASIRRGYLTWAERRVTKPSNLFRSDADYAARALALKLLLSRGTGESDSVFGLFKRTGVSHVFALSGMHLGIVAELFAVLLGKLTGRRMARLISVPFVSVYFFLTSRSPSFIRSYLVFLLSFVFRGGMASALPVAFMLQLALFPRSFASVAFDFSYCACCGMATLWRPLSFAVRNLAGKRIASPLSLGLSASVFSGVVSVVRFGEFRPLGILLTPPVSFFAAVILAVSFALLAFSENAFLLFVLRLASCGLNRMLDAASSFSPDSGAAGYAAFLSSLAFLALTFVVRARKGGKFRHGCLP